MADRLISIFPTTIMHRHLDGMEETNRQLQALVAHIAATEPNNTTGTTTEGGFQTKEDLFQRANPGWSLVRSTASSYTATEGWAHYSEQMMLDEGLGEGNPRLRLAQLQDALLRDCRLVASIGMHTRQMSLAQATTMMADQCFQPASVAPKEARRGTSDPGYFSYTLGKLEIQKLRADVQAKEGAAFTLAHFHDRFLNAGLIPIAMIRREILGVDGPAL